MKTGIWKAAQRAISATACEDCGSTRRLERHHHDYSKPLDVRVLCHRCHMREHARLNLPRRMKRCAICPREFLPNHSKNHKTCSRECLSEIGRRNAAKALGPHALCNRADRLRALGNAVVPDQAELAFLILAERAGLVTELLAKTAA